MPDAELKERVASLAGSQAPTAARMQEAAAKLRRLEGLFHSAWTAFVALALPGAPDFQPRAF